MDEQNEVIAKLKKEVTQLGKKVAESHSATQFPEWCLFKIGVATIEGFPYEVEFWEDRIRQGRDAESS